MVAIGCTLIIAVFGYGVVYMRTSVNLLKMFHSEAKIIKDYAWLEEHLGQLVPMEVVVRVPKAEQRPANVELRQLQEELGAETTSAARRAQIEKIVRDSQFQLPFLERMEFASRIQSLIEQEFGPEGAKSSAARSAPQPSSVLCPKRAAAHRLTSSGPPPAAAYKPTATTCCTAIICAS